MTGGHRDRLLDTSKKIETEESKETYLYESIINADRKLEGIIYKQMTETEKQKLIDAVNSKFPRNNIMELFYNIGRALPFTVQRFPDGRVSDWYRNQYIEVHELKPGGKGGKYGKAFGFYFRKGKRADAVEDAPEHSWCKSDDKEPQLIPNSGCGSWKLLDIIGEPTMDIPKILGLDDKIDFGKHNGLTIREIIEKDWNYLQWAMLETASFFVDVEAVNNYRNCCNINAKD